MTLIDALAALQEGAVPTNHQVLAFLSRLLSAFPPEKKLSKSGRGLVSDCKGALESLKKIVEHRNGNEELQEFLWKSRGTADRIGEEGLKIRWGKGATSKKERLGEEGRANGNKKSSVQEKASDVAKMIKNDGMQGTYLSTLDSGWIMLMLKFPSRSYSTSSYIGEIDVGAARASTYPR